ncbi:atp synthase e chain domain-containing [Trichoderma arundinaceum]|uniref:ATP synthase F(0) complex subunit e, mitochondrial n=1 Tax=Trichoderma arundinaceum TaxID=490622 RepID=A0A395NXV4_TRIAR|nr:atp synthase e chain domain-containing [Trichoderma arundinaceum]
MSSTGVNVLRWSALAFGVFYGFSHQRTITTTQRAQHAQHEYEQKQKLIDQAKAEYAKKKNPSVASADDGMHIRDAMAWHLPPLSRGVTLAARGEGGGTMRMARFRAGKANSGIVVTDVNSPDFDLEKFLLKVAKESP